MNTEALCGMCASCIDVKKMEASNFFVSFRSEHFITFLVPLKFLFWHVVLLKVPNMK